MFYCRALVHYVSFRCALFTNSRLLDRFRAHFALVRSIFALTRTWLTRRWLGVDHIYLTENGPTPPASLVEELQEFIDDGFITFRVDPRPMFQQTIYVDCMTQQRHKHNWMAFIDLDEFIVLRECVPLLLSARTLVRQHPSIAKFALRHCEGQN